MRINNLATHYVSFRKTLGERCTVAETILRRFGRAVGPRTRVDRIRLKAVTAFLAGTGPVTRAWFAKYHVLKGFFQFAVSRGHLNKLPLPTELPKFTPTFVPYIYSRDELRRMLDAIPSTQPSHCRMEAPTMRAILLLMYGAGLRTGEVLKLSIANVDLPNALLTIRGTKFFKSRLVPVSRDLAKVLSDYARWRSATHPSTNDNGHFFVGRHGAPVHRCTLDNAFKRLREHAGVRRTDSGRGRYQPRLHDLRHTFAVHRLTAWYRQNADVQRLIHHLSVYLGHAHLADTQVYLTMTPELLEQAGTFFERYARRGRDYA